jgi:hypothetical protein
VRQVREVQPEEHGERVTLLDGVVQVVNGALGHVEIVELEVTWATRRFNINGAESRFVSAG